MNLCFWCIKPWWISLKVPGISAAIIALLFCLLVSGQQKTTGTFDEDDIYSWDRNVWKSYGNWSRVGSTFSSIHLVELRIWFVLYVSFESYPSVLNVPTTIYTVWFGHNIVAFELTSNKIYFFISWRKIRSKFSGLS